MLDFSLWSIDNALEWNIINSYTFSKGRPDTEVGIKSQMTNHQMKLVSLEEIGPGQVVKKETQCAFNFEWKKCSTVLPNTVVLPYKSSTSNYWPNALLKLRFWPLFWNLLLLLLPPPDRCPLKFLFPSRCPLKLLFPPRCPLKPRLPSRCPLKLR